MRLLKRLRALFIFLFIKESPLTTLIILDFGSDIFLEKKLKRVMISLMDKNVGIGEELTC